MSPRACGVTPRPLRGGRCAAAAGPLTMRVLHAVLALQRSACTRADPRGARKDAFGCRLRTRGPAAHAAPGAARRSLQMRPTSPAHFLAAVRAASCRALAGRRPNVARALTLSACARAGRRAARATRQLREGAAREVLLASTPRATPQAHLPVPPLRQRLRGCWTRRCSSALLRPRARPTCWLRWARQPWLRAALLRVADSCSRQPSASSCWTRSSRCAACRLPSRCIRRVRGSDLGCAGG